MSETKIDIMVSYACMFIGLPYKWGGDDSINGFDCSGLIIECLKGVGFYKGADTTAQGLFEHLSSNNWIEKKERGSLLFFGKSRQKITHIALAISDEIMIEAGGGDSTTINSQVASKQNAFVRIRPIANRKDLVAYLYPVY